MFNVKKNQNVAYFVACWTNSNSTFVFVYHVCTTMKISNNERKHFFSLVQVMLATFHCQLKVENKSCVSLCGMWVNITAYLSINFYIIHKRKTGTVKIALLIIKQIILRKCYFIIPTPRTKLPTTIKNLTDLKQNNIAFLSIDKYS